MAGGLTYHRSVLSAADWGTFGAVDDSNDDLTLSPLASERKRVASADTGSEPAKAKHDWYRDLEASSSRQVDRRME